MICRELVSPYRALWLHISIVSVVGVELSVIIDHDVAWVTLTSFEIKALEKARPVKSLILIPLSFATLLQDMNTFTTADKKIRLLGINSAVSRWFISRRYYFVNY